MKNGTTEIDTNEAFVDQKTANGETPEEEEFLKELMRDAQVFISCQ